jgi:hypothetical protein
MVLHILVDDDFRIGRNIAVKLQTVAHEVSASAWGPNNISLLGLTTR